MIQRLNEIKGRSQPECVPCRNHGTHVAKKGHKSECPNKDCMCGKCILLFDRRNVEKKIKDANSKEGKHESRIQLEICDKMIAKTNDNALDISSKMNQFYEDYRCRQIKALSSDLANKRSRISNYKIYPYQNLPIRPSARREHTIVRNGIENMADNDHKQTSPTSEDIKHSIDNILKKDNDKDSDIERQGSHDMIAQNENISQMRSGKTNGLFAATDSAVPFIAKTDCQYIYRYTDISLHLKKKEDSNQLMIQRTDSRMRRTYNEFVHQLESWPQTDASLKYQQFGCGQRNHQFSG